jgi:hypothetical protein
MKNSKHRGLLAVLALSLLLVACDRNNNLPGNELSGKPVSVRIRSLKVAEGGEEDIIRSALHKEVETVSMPLGNGLLLEMRMERDTSLLRAGQIRPLADGSLFRVIAVRHDDDTYVSHGDFRVGPGEDTQLSTFHVPENISYDFICFSYNKDSLPSAAGYAKGDPLPALLVNNSTDLLWCEIADRLVNSAASAELEITLNQKLARVKVVVDCKYNEWTITDIGTDMTLGSGVVSGAMDLAAGSISGTDGDQAIPWSYPITEADEQTSESLFVIPKASGDLTITIPVGSIARGGGLSALPSGTTSANVSSVGEYAAALVGGASYKFHVRLRVPIFAGSNIYWDNTAQKLTFDESATHQGYQGVFFKWGSLVGVSPAEFGVGDYTFSSSVPVYVPDAVATSGWVISSAYSTWEGAGSIPYWDCDTYGDVIDNTHTSDWVGDICQYLNPSYRLPTYNEFGTMYTSWDDTNPTTTPVAGGWVKGTGSFEHQGGAGYADGTADLLRTDGNGATQIFGSAINQTMNNATFPASGYRDRKSGYVVHVGEYGYYWSSTPASSVSPSPISWSLDLVSSSVGPILDHARNAAFPIRCVKN